MMTMLQQELATAVYARIEAYRENHGDDACDTYGRMVMKLPVLVRTAGLVQALAFVEMKGQAEGGESFRHLLEDLSAVVLEDGGDDLVAASRAATLTTDYIHLTRRTLLALDWFKRFAQTVLDVDVTDPGEGG